MLTLRLLLLSFASFVVATLAAFLALVAALLASCTALGSLIRSAFLGLVRGWFRVALTWLDNFFDGVAVERNRVQGEVGGVREGVDLTHGDSRIFFELVRSQERQYRVGVVGKDDVTGGIKLYQDMEGVLLLAEGEVHNTINAELRDIFQLFRSQVLS